MSNCTDEKRYPAQIDQWRDGYLLFYDGTMSLVLDTECPIDTPYVSHYAGGVYDYAAQFVTTWEGGRS
jgi:hypothetical protein